MGTWDAGGAGIVELPDGLRVRGRGLRRPPEGPDPELGVYLLGRRPPCTRWPALWVPWRDFGTPASTPQAMEVLRRAHEHARRQRVEIACGGGTGRTGTALALLAIMSGVPEQEAVTWVREHYRRRAVETPGQRRWLPQAAALLAQPPQQPHTPSTSHLHRPGE